MSRISLLVVAATAMLAAAPLKAENPLLEKWTGPNGGWLWDAAGRRLSSQSRHRAGGGDGRLHDRGRGSPRAGGLPPIRRAPGIALTAWVQ